MSTTDSNTNNIIYTDRRNVLTEALESLHDRVSSGEIQSIAMVILTEDGSVECLESYKNNTDRMALIGATQVLSRHIMSG